MTDIDTILANVAGHDKTATSGPDVVVHCGHCGGVLAPVAEGRGEG
jgi:hypothetical protein